jgi:predicted XRE-type DNA-binding protein
MKTNEMWKPFPGYEGYYEVSSMGNVRRCSLLKPSATTWGYLTVAPTAPDRGQTRVVVHRKVLEAFSGPPPSPHHVANHINGDKHDNRIDNLEWVTQSENVSHAYRTGLKKRYFGTANAFSKLTEEQVSEILIMVANRVGQKEICAAFGIPQKTVSDIVNGRRWSHVPRPPELDHRRKYGKDKLSEEQVREIRQLVGTKTKSNRQIAALYGVNEANIRAIASGKTWKHVV